MNKKFFSFLVITTLFAGILTSCGEDENSPMEYTVYFDTGDDGSVVEPQKVKKGEKATKPDSPTRSGYTFDVWYREVELTNEWKFDDDVVTTNITLHAKWNEDNGNGDLCNVCGKEDCVCDEGAVQLLESIYHDGKLSSEYEYDEQNRITKITSYNYNIDETLNNTIIKKYSYNNAGDLTSIFLEYPSHTQDNESTTYTKFGNIITWKKNNANYTVVLNSKGVPEKQTVEYTKVEFNSSTMSTFSYFVRETNTYQYTNDNVSKITFVMATGPTSANVSTSYTSTQTYTHDNKKSPFYHCKTPKWIMILDGRSIKNNILTEIHHHHDDDYGLFTSIYTYDSEGFPSEGTTTFIWEMNGQQKGEYVVEYKYKNIE